MLTTLFDCEVRELLHVSRHTAVYRGVRRVDQEPVVIKVLEEETPSPRRVAALRHEHSLLQMCSGEGVIRAYGLEEENGRYGIVMEDYGGESLSSAHLAGALSTKALIELSITLAAIVEGVHRHRVVHQDINPANLLIHPKTGQVKVIDFGIASVLPDDEQGFGALSALQGTLPYISPEQTGRMNRPVDERADLYSLGVTLYELATGRRPFVVEDPLELVHCHIARRPPPPTEFHQGVPDALSEVILKLLSKNADDRYGSARGLGADLRLCLDRLGPDGRIAAFPLGAKDRTDRIHFPRRLYGREPETRTLLNAFERATGAAMLVLVSGYAGVGKTALIHEVHRPITERRGQFVAGKYDQLQNAPYGAFLKAFEELAGLIFTDSSEEVAAWRARLLEALGANMAVLAELCPAFTRIVGPQPPPPHLPPSEARARFHEAAYSLVALFARPEHPLCLFVDDLQWADADSLNLLQELVHMARDSALLLIGAYRENEVDEAHPLRLTIRQIEDQGSAITRLPLSPLSSHDVGEMLGDTLHLKAQVVAPLSELVFARTAGNPFFLRAFVLSLRTEGLLEQTADAWTFNLLAIRERGVTDNVVDLLSSRIARLPGPTREILRRAACLGADFDLGTLSTVARRPVSGAGLDLWPAIAEGLILPLDRVHSSIEAGAAPELRFRFAHDRIQQASLASLDEATLVELARDVGRRLLNDLDTEEQRERWLFEIANELNRGRAAISDPGELEQLAHINLRAARKALSAAAAQPALAYVRAGLALLSEEDWECRYDLARDLHDAGIEAAFACADLETVQGLSAVFLARARTPLEEARVRRVEGKVLHAQMRIVEAIDTYADLLRRLGFPLPSPVTPEAIGAEMQQAEEGLAARSIESLVSLPRCTDEAACAALDVLNRMIFLTISVSHPLFLPVICKAVQISLAQGHTAESAFAYTSYGLLLTGQGDFERAARLGRAAIAIADDFGDKGIRSLVYLYAHVQLIHYTQPLHDIASRFVDAYRFGMEAGSPFPAAAAHASWCIARFLSGDPLGEVTADMVRGNDVSARFRQTIVQGWLDPYHQAAHNLSAETSDTTAFAGPFYDEEVRLKGDGGDGGGRANYHFCKTVVCYIFGNFNEAASHARAWAAYAGTTGTSIQGPPWAMWEALALMGRFSQADEHERAAILEAVTADEAKLRTALPYCPKTIAHKLSLVEAEHARVDGREGDARTAFERAVDLARGSGYLHEEALACELAARFHLGRRDVRTARDRFREAHAAYLRWGAVNKVRALETELPHLLPRVASVTFSPVTLTGTRSGEWDLNVLDLVSVINASQAISREVDPDRLLMRLMDLLIETGGAQSGALLRERDGRWLVEAEKNIDKHKAVVFGTVDMAEPDHRGVPQSVVNYVARTGEPLVLDDAAGSTQFRRDPHIAKHEIASVLCFPLPHQSERRWIVYLENNLMKGAFAPGRIKILLLLSTQAVISLDHAQLYRTLENRVTERTRELSLKNDELSATLEKLHQAQDRMIVQDRLASLGSLTAGIAHELRNPLNFVNNFAELSLGLLRDAREQLSDPEELARTFEDLEGNAGRILESGRRMDGIIRSMLAHSRGGQGERQEMELNRLVREFAGFGVQGLRARTPPIEVALDLSLDAGVGWHWIVPQEMSRVVLNLIDNAGHAVNEKRKTTSDAHYEPRIHVVTRSFADRVEIRVHDNGVGIPDAIHERIFHPFFTTKRTGEGTGLGLSICHDIIVKSYRGSIAFNSKAGEYSEFVVSLPRPVP